MQQLHHIKFEKGKEELFPSTLTQQPSVFALATYYIIHVLLVAANSSPLSLESLVAQTELACPPLSNRPVQVVI